MMYELKQVESLDSQKQKIRLHPDVMEILIENRRYIKNVFLNLKGLFNISHMSLTCLNPSHEVVVFSTTPNIEYNLIHQNLWINDPCFMPDVIHKNSLLWWDYELEKIAKIRLFNNQFTLGITICRPVGDFCFAYSFATKEKDKNLREFYESNLFGLIDVGDYFYKSIKELYSSYTENPPQLSEFNSKASFVKIKPFLRVVKK